MTDAWAALQLDNAAVLIGTGVEAAAQEMQKVGPDDKPEYKPRYSMKQLLGPDFRLPPPDDDHGDDFTALEGTRGLIMDEVG